VTCSLPRRRFAARGILGPKGQESIAQGLPWVIAPTRICPEGATRYVENRLQTFEPERRRISGPYRAKRLSGLTQGKPWAKLSCPYGAGPSGCMTSAKHIQTLGYAFLAIRAKDASTHRYSPLKRTTNFATPLRRGATTQPFDALPLAQGGPGFQPQEFMG